MLRVWAWSLIALSPALLPACSGSGDRDGHRGFNPGAQNGANTGGGAGSTMGGGFDKPQQIGPTPTMHMDQPSTMMMPETNIGPLSIDDCGANNPAALSPDDAQKLMAGGGSTGLRILYPYDGTVFPRGLLSPLFMWDGATGPADAVYVHIKSMLFEYKGCLKPTADGQLQLAQDVWDQAGTHTLGSGDPYTIEISTLSAGAVQGPANEQITIAQATIKGSIYYNSYTSMLPGAPDPGGGMSLIPGAALPTVGGSVLRIPPGGTAERFVSTTCNGCHSLSASGSRLISQQMLIGGFSYQLAPDSMPNPPQMVAGPRSSFGAMYPDGRAFLATSVVIEIARAGLTQALDGPTDATLYNTDDGTVIDGTGIPGGALMPMFSPDGTLLAFNDYAAGEAHGIALMDYDTANNKASNYRVIHMETDPLRPGWPFILPDDKGVVFTATDGGDFSGEGAGLAGLNVLGPSSDLYMVDVQTGTTQIMARAMGYATPDDAKNGTTYLPFGADELHKNYFPTVSPVAAGGYFWIFFDSVRHYGNLGAQRQLWGAAVDIAPDGSYAIDRSHPAYYLPGQEFGTGNHRAFAALDPCKMDGDSCTSGIDCCGGFCSIPESTDTEFGIEPVGTCSSNTPMCSKTNERCATTADCCPPEDGQHANTCIAGFCAYVPGPD